MFLKFKHILNTLTAHETRLVIGASIFFFCVLITRTGLAIHNHSVFIPIEGGEYREGIVGQPIIIHPVFSENQPDKDISALLFTPLGDLLSALEVNDTGDLYTLKLKEDLLWDDGERLTSDDIFFTIKTIQDPRTHSPLLKNWQGVETTRESELKLTLHLPSPYIFMDRIINRLTLLPQHIYRALPKENSALSSYNLAPVGNGPYMFKNLITRKDGFISEYHLVPNIHYFRALPFIQSFVVVFYETLDALFNDLTIRRIDGMGGRKITNSLPPSFKIEPIGTAESAILFLNLQNDTLKNISLRTKLKNTLSRVSLARLAFPCCAYPITNLLSLSSPEEFSEENKTTTQPIESLLSSLTTNDAPSLTLSFPSTDLFIPIAQELKKMWEMNNSAHITLDPLTPREFTQKTNARTYDLLLAGIALDIPEDLFSLFHSSERFTPGTNLSGYQNQEVDKLLEATRETKDEEKRMAFVSRAWQLIERDISTIPLFSIPYLYAHEQSLEGFNEQNIIRQEDRFLNVTDWHNASVRVWQ